MRRVGPRQLRGPAHQTRRRIHTPGRRRPHQDKHRPQEQRVKRHGGSRGKKGCDNERREVQHGDHGVPPSPTTSCGNGNGTPSTKLNVLKTHDLSFLEKSAFVGWETRRGQPDAHLMLPFGRTSNQSYCTRVRKTTRQHAGLSPERKKVANLPSLIFNS
jgi:hypothetical protein